jgi:hypothetical protein
MLVPNTNVKTKSTRNMKNNTFATEAAPAAMPPNPITAAMIAMIKNDIDQRNMIDKF